MHQARRRRLVVAGLGCLLHIVRPVKLAGDYLIYRTGRAGKFPSARLPYPLLKLWWAVRVMLALVLLPGLWVLGASLLLGVGLPWFGAAILSTLATASVYRALERFDHAWEHVESYSVGSARQLAGTCVIFQVFVGPKWRARDKERARREVRRACNWLEAQARHHGVELTLETGPSRLLTLPDARVSGPCLTYPDPWRAYQVELNGVSKEVRMLRPAWSATITERLLLLNASAQNHCLIAHVPGRGVGFAMPAHNDLAHDTPLEVCVCGRKSGAAVHCHELLHLFGAPDLYLHPWRILTQRKEADEWGRLLDQRVIQSAGEILEAHFGNSIMCSVRPGLDYLSIDAITARAIGWRPADEEFMSASMRLEGARLDMIEAAFDDVDA